MTGRRIVRLVRHRLANEAVDLLPVKSAWAASIASFLGLGPAGVGDNDSLANL